MNKIPLTVTQLNMYAKSVIDCDKNLRSVAVKGEISNFSRHLKSGHVYFTLKDSNAAVKSVMFKSNADRISFFLGDGISVIALGKVSLYERDGTYQFYVEDIEPDGIGAYRKAFDKLKEKLELQGLFDQKHKKKIPKYPERIGVITSPIGAALKDVLSVLQRRYPIAVPVLFPCSVQGEGTSETIIEGLRHFNETGDVDVIIITRGGGSYEDLSAFNNEDLAVAVYESDIPVISAVGHEIDYTIIDYVADLRAPTPSAAAELVVPLKDYILEDLREKKNAMVECMRFRILCCENSLSKLRENLNYESFFKCKEGFVMSEVQFLKNCVDKITESKIAKLSEECSKLKTLDPLSVLTRGFSVVSVNGQAVKSVKDIKTDESFEVRLKDGVIKGVAEKIIEY